MKRQRELVDFVRRVVDYHRAMVRDRSATLNIQVVGDERGGPHVFLVVRQAGEMVRVRRKDLGSVADMIQSALVEGFNKAPYNNLSFGKRIERQRSPRVAQFALLLIPQKSREHLVGDLEEEYRSIILLDYGSFWARVWYWEQTVLALGFYVWPFLRRVLGMAAIWKVIGR